MVTTTTRPLSNYAKAFFHGDMSLKDFTMDVSHNTECDVEVINIRHLGVGIPSTLTAYFKCQLTGDTVAIATKEGIAYV